MIPGVYITDLTHTADPPGAHKINSVLLVVGRLTDPGGQDMAADYWIHEIPTESDIAGVMGQVSPIITDTYRSLRHLAPECRIFMVAGLVPIGSHLPKFLEIVERIENPESLPLSIVLCPELDIYSSLDPASAFIERAPIRSALAQFAQEGEHLYFMNLGPEIYTLADAIAICRYLGSEINLSSGHTAAWFGWSVGDSFPLSLAVDAAAHTINQNQFLSGIYVPAGEEIYTARPVSPLYTLDYEQAEQALHLGLFNFAFKTPGGWSLSGDVTLGNGGMKYLANRLAMSIFRQRVISGMVPHQFDAIGSPPSPSDIELVFLGPLLEICDRAKSDRIIETFDITEARPQDGGVNLAVTIQPFGSIHVLDVQLKGEHINE